MTTEERRQLVAAGLMVADHLDARRYAYTGIIRRLAAEVAAGTPTVEPGHCPVCGGPVTHPARGRRRTYCGPACKRRAESRRNATLGA